MTAIDTWEAAFKDLGATLVTKPDWAKNGLRLSALFPAEKIVAVAKRLYTEGFTLLDISTAEFSEGFLVTYHFDTFEKEPFRVAARVLLTDKSRPEVPSVYPVFQGAEWHERESHDFFGVVFVGNPNLVPLLLPHDLPGDPPLLKKPEALASLFALNFLGDQLFSDGTYPAPGAKEGEGNV
jgi:NADH-quinone oxidoreductase subunit C